MLLCFVTQGGDLIKWDKAKVGYYVGVDIAEGSVSFLSHKTFILRRCVLSVYSANPFLSCYP